MSLLGWLVTGIFAIFVAGSAVVVSILLWHIKDLPSSCTHCEEKEPNYGTWGMG